MVEDAGRRAGSSPAAQRVGVVAVEVVEVLGVLVVGVLVVSVDVDVDDEVVVV
jgi:hypothetical protein